MCWSIYVQIILNLYQWQVNLLERIVVLWSTYTHIYTERIYTERKRMREKEIQEKMEDRVKRRKVEERERKAKTVKKEFYIRQIELD